MSVKLSSWITEHGVGEVECIIPDMNGVQRGKVLPAKKFLGSVKDGTLPPVIKLKRNWEANASGKICEANSV